MNKFSARLYTADENAVPVQLLVDDNGVHVLDHEYRLNFHDLQLTVAGHDGDRIKISTPDKSIVLMCTDPRLVEALAAHQGPAEISQEASRVHGRLRSLSTRKASYWLGVIGIILLLSIGGYFLFGVLADAAVATIDPKMEAVVGDFFVNEDKVTKNEKYKARIKRIGERIASHVKDLHLPSPYKFKFYVYDNPVVNAYALPGGAMIINTGFIEQAKNDGEIAGVMGHEIGHVLHRDQLRGMVHNLGIAGVIAILCGNSEQLKNAAPMLKTLESLNFTRSQEAAADIVGTDLAYYSDYNPEDFIGFFDRMRKQNGGSDNKIVGMLSDHPMDSERIETIRKEIQRLQSLSGK